MDAHEEFLTLFLTHQGDLRAFIGSLVRDPHARDDMLQEVTLVLWREFALYDRTRSFGAWARGIAANKLLQRRDQTARTPVSLAPEAVEAIQAAYDRTAPHLSTESDALEHCLDKLPAKSRQLLSLRYESTLRLAEIAQQLRSTPDAVHKALSRLRGKLLDCVTRRLAATHRVAEGS